MSNLIEYITTQVSALAPIAGISFGSMNDTSTWIIYFNAAATAAQQQAAQTYIASINTNTIVPVPQSVTPYQAKAALQSAGLLTTVQAAVTASTNPLVNLAWEYADAFDRNGQFITGMAASIPLTDAQVDALFIQAATITT